MRRLIFILCAMIGVSQAQTIQYIGAPTTTVISRGNFRTDSIFYLPKRTKLPTDTAALRYQISDSSLYTWTGSQWRKVGADPDSLIFSTRAWRQKGDDSLAARINLKVNISDTAAMLAPYLRKADTTAMLSPYLRKADTATLSNRINLKLNISDTSSMLGNYVRHAGYGLTKSGQSFLVDTLNIATRAWRQKGIDSVAGLSRVGGSGTTNTVAKFTASGTIGNSTIFDNGTTISTSTPIQINPTSAGSSYQQFKYSGTDVALLGTDASISGGSASDFGIYTYGANNMDLWTNNARRLRITSGGQVGVNITTPDVGTIFQVARGTDGTVATLGRSGGTINPRLRIDVSEANNTVSLNPNYQGGTSPAITFLTAETERMRIFANGRVFVGASPTDAGYQFDVNGTLRSVNGANFATTSGNVGIGTASPLSKLHAFGAGGSTAVKLTLSNGGDVNALNDPMGVIDFYSDDASGGLQGTKGYLGVYNEFNGNWDGSGSRYDTYMAFGTSLDNSLSEKMRITASGNVGIGTASPQQILHANATTGAYLQLSRTAQGGTTSPFGGIYFGDGTTFQEAAILSGADGNVVSGNMAFYTRAAAGSLLEGFRINSNQEMLVGGGSDAGDYKLQVSGNVLATDVAGSYPRFVSQVGAKYWEMGYRSGTTNFEIREDGTTRFIIDNGGEVFINTDSDAGDYKLQVVGNARVGTGKLDIASNTTFGLGVARSGTSEVAGQIYNSSGILYLGAESSTGGQIFSGSSAYAAVIGSGANYPLQFGANNITRATLTTGGNFMIGFPTDTYFYRLQVNGSIFSNNQIIAQNTAAQLNIDSSTNISPLYISNQSLTGSSAQGLFYGSTTWNTTGNPSLIDLAITNTASGSDANYIKISDGSNIFRVTKAAEVVTAAPTGGSIRKWKLGEAATVSPTSPNRTIRVEIDGTVYYLHAKTTND